MQHMKPARECQALKNDASGYQMNSQLQDGKSYATAKNLHTDMRRTSYGSVFNQPKPFHKPELKNSTGRKRYGSKTFDFKDGNNPNKNWVTSLTNYQGGYTTYQKWATKQSNAIGYKEPRQSNSKSFLRSGNQMTYAH